jgi:hypothetical protein
MSEAATNTKKVAAGLSRLLIGMTGGLYGFDPEGDDTRQHPVHRLRPATRRVVQAPHTILRDRLDLVLDEVQACQIATHLGQGVGR